MLKHLKNLIDTAAKGKALLLGVVLLWGLLIGLSDGTAWKPVVSASLPATIGFVLLYQSWLLWSAMKRRLIRREILLVQSWCALTSRTQFSEMMHLYSVALAFIAAAIAGLAGPSPGRFVLAGAFTILAFAGLCDTAVLVSRLVKRTWAPTAGKFLALTFGVVLAAISLVKAKDIAQSVTHVDPKYFSEFTTVLTCCMLPIVYISAVAILMLLYAAAQMSLMLFISALSILFNPFNLAARRPPKKPWYLTWYRLRNGKSPPRGELPQSLFFSREEILRMTAPISKLALAVLLAIAYQYLLEGVPALMPAFSRWMVSMEYRSNSACANIDVTTPVAYMDDGWVSVALATPDGIAFSVKKCEFLASPAS